MLFYDEVRENLSMPFFFLLSFLSSLLPCSPASLLPCSLFHCSPAPLAQAAPLRPCSPVSLLPCTPALLFPCFLALTPLPPTFLLLCFPAPLPPCSPPLLSSRFVFLSLHIACNHLICLCFICFQSLGYALDPEGERFDDMKDLIRHYYKFNLPKCDVKLTRPYK